MATLFRDLRFAGRMLRKNPGSTTAIVLCLALSIGANTAVFSLLNAVLLRDLPYREPDRIAMVWNRFLGEERPKVELSSSEFLDLRDQVHSFTEVAATRSGLFNLTGDGEPDLVVGVRVSANLFRLLGVDAAVGRTFLPDEDQPGRGDVVVLSHGLFERRFGSDPKLIGRKILIDGQPFTVVGVTPRDFYFRRKGRDLWMPLVIDRAAPLPREERTLEAYARLKPGVTPEKAQAELDALAQRFARGHAGAYPKDSGYGMTLIPYSEEVVGAVRPSLLLLSAAVGLVLVIACANISNLLLARATTRGREIAVRAALGAGRGGLVRQFLTESLLLALGSGALGLLLTAWGVEAVTKLDLSQLPRLDEVAVDGRVLAFTVLISLLTGIAFGLIPALRISRTDFLQSLQEGGKSSEGTRRQLARQALVVVEVAVALVVLLGAGMMIQSYRQLQRVDPGFKTDDILTFELRLPSVKYSEPHQWTMFYDRLLERLRDLPGVIQAGAINAVPLGVVQVTGDIAIEGAPPLAPGQALPTTAWRKSSPGYFQALGIPLLQGRDFTRHDNDKSEPVIIIDQSSARRFWPNQNPIGKRLRLVGSGAPEEWRSVVGVVGDVKHEGLETTSLEQIYIPYPQYPHYFMYLVLHTSSDANAMAPLARRAVLELDKDQSIFRVETMETKLVRSMAWRRFYTLMLGTLAVVALALAGVGVYSVMAFSVTQRTREIGIRLALGAKRRTVLQLVVRQALGLVGMGVALGLATALGLLRLISNLLYGVAATDLKILIGGALLLTVLALLASYLPARRASRVDPLIALRAE
jgi:putative ABC transport system permease protein